MNIPYLDLQRLTQTYEPALSEAIGRVVRSGWFLYGEETAAFEREFAAFCGSSHALGVANGLDALTLILRSQRDIRGWQQGDEVIVPAFTFIASVEAVSRAGLTPVLCDVRTTDALLDEDRIEALVTQRTRAIMPVHLYGMPCQMSTLLSIAARHDLFVVEDCAQAHGARFSDGRRVGAAGHAAAFSFYPGKNLGALGDGGAIVSNDEKLIARCKMHANYGMRHKYVHDVQGLNSRLDEVQAAVLRVKLRMLDVQNDRRRQMTARLRSVRNPHIRLPYGSDDAAMQSVYHIFPVFCHERDALQAYLQQHGVQTQIHYPIPPHRQQAYASLNSRSFPVAEELARTELSLPLHPALSEEELAHICHTLETFSC